MVSLKKYAITGSHGKTTTTSLIARYYQIKINQQLLTEVINSLKSNAKLGKEWAILEADSLMNFKTTY